MLYYKFKNYEEFKELFGIVKHGNGNKSRKNKILLAFIKNKELLHNAVVSGDYTLLHISDITTMKNTVIEKIIRSGGEDETLSYCVNLIGKTYYSSTYGTDGNKGLWEDGDMKAVRYINYEKGEKIFKMKAGKFYRAIILETAYGKTLPETILNFLCEEFASEWQTYSMGKLPKNKLFVNKDFERIYSSDCCEGDFDSCMVDKEQHSFYENAVNASAAYLENEEGKIIARCIIFNEVKDQDGKIWRLAERQYSSEGNEILKRALIDTLIKGKYIDGYKRIGASCNEPNAFVNVDGNSLSGKRFTIDCDLGWDETLSYQDSFKWYNMGKRIADNYGNGELDLGTTEDCLDNSEKEYDDYHGYYCESTTCVYVGGREYYCNTNDLSDFVWVECEDEFHHKDDVEECPECGEYFVTSRGKYSDITEEYYCNDDCLDNAEAKYKRENWYYSDYDEDYYETEDEITSFYKWNSIIGEYEKKTISEKTVDELLDKEKLYRFGDELFDTVDCFSNLPYGYQLIKMAV